MSGFWMECRGKLKSIGEGLAFSLKQEWWVSKAAWSAWFISSFANVDEHRQLGMTGRNTHLLKAESMQNTLSKSSTGCIWSGAAYLWFRVKSSHNASLDWMPHAYAKAMYTCAYLFILGSLRTFDNWGEDKKCTRNIIYMPTSSGLRSRFTVLLTMQTTPCMLESLCDSHQQKGKVTRLF